MRTARNVLTLLTATGAVTASTLALADEGGALRCIGGEHDRVNDGDGETAVRLVCDALRDAGAPTGQTYRVTLRRLGQSLLLDVDAEDAPGAVVRSRTIGISRVEEVPIAAPRLADALVNDRALSETQAYGNLVSSETGLPLYKSGAPLWSIGLVGGNVLGTNQNGLLSGLAFGARYETADWAAGGEIAFGGGSTGSTDAAWFSASVGGRRMLLDTEITPYLGAGLAWTAASIDDTSDDDRYEGGYDYETDSYRSDSEDATAYSGAGIGAYAEVGLEVMRFHRGRIMAGLRADLPFYVLNRESGGDTKYAVPLTLNVSVAF